MLVSDKDWGVFWHILCSELSSIECIGISGLGAALQGVENGEEQNSWESIQFEVYWISYWKSCLLSESATDWRLICYRILVFQFFLQIFILNFFRLCISIPMSLELGLMQWQLGGLLQHLGNALSTCSALEVLERLKAKWPQDSTRTSLCCSSSGSSNS